jgi:hypothetical protein
MLQTAAYTDLLNFIVKRIYKAQYRMGGTWRDTSLVGKEVKNGIARIKVQISPGVAGTITGVRLINTESQVWAVKELNITHETPDTNLLQWFDFEITEEEES